MIVYDPLWATMERLGVTEEELLADGISDRELERLKSNRDLSTETIDKLCRILRCKISDVMEAK